MEKNFSTCLRSVSWGMFTCIPILFVVSLLLPEWITVILLPVALLVAICVLFIDLVRKTLFCDEQVFKFLIYALVGTYTCNVYNWKLAGVILGCVAIIVTFVQVVYFIALWDKIEEEGKKID